jgi:hypothetical protein
MAAGSGCLRISTDELIMLSRVQLLIFAVVYAVCGPYDTGIGAYSTFSWGGGGENHVALHLGFKFCLLPMGIFHSGFFSQAIILTNRAEKLSLREYPVSRERAFHF